MSQQDRLTDSSGHRDYPMRLQKFLARAGVASRRGSENLMTAGRVTVNGEVVTELGAKVDPLADKVAVDGIEVVWGSKPVVILLNKPAGYVSTMSDPHARHTVAELVPVREYPGLFPVGRLDMDTTGVLLFTTDGELGHQLLGPKHKVPKVYEARVAGTLTADDARLLEQGIELEDGMTLPAKVQLLGWAASWLRCCYLLCCWLGRPASGCARIAGPKAREGQLLGQKGGREQGFQKNCFSFYKSRL